MRKIVLILSVVILSGCASATYTPSSSPSTINKVIILDKPYDEVWDYLITEIASTYFGIDNFEKQSGLITLTFTSSTLSDFVTGGNMKASNLRFSYDGDYVDYLQQYLGGSLLSKMNIVIQKIDNNKTKVTLNTRYVVSTTVANTTWVFNTNGSQTVQVNALYGAIEERTISPTHKAELDILNALKTFE